METNYYDAIDNKISKMESRKIHKRRMQFEENENELAEITK